jgi:hypothetical protein
MGLAGVPISYMTARERHSLQRVASKPIEIEFETFYTCEDAHDLVAMGRLFFH